jgi:digeranylgeranylglycerophospholipid reductase
LIVGGGPAGLSAAQAVAAAGKSALVVHRDKEIGRPVRTSGGSWERELRRLEIPPHLYQPIDRLTLAGPTATARYRFESDRPVVLDVTETYRYLAERARAAGAEIERGASFMEIVDRSEEGAVCRVSGPEGERRIAARYLVDASGHSRAVLASAGLAEKPRRVGIGIEYEMENRSDPNHAVLFVGSRFAPSGYGWIFPTRLGTVRVGVGVIRPDAQTAPKALLDDFLESDFAGELELKAGEVVERHAGAIPSDGPSDRLVYGRIVAVGDSAGQALPLVGEGIRYCIEAGRVAGAALAAALRRPERSESELRRYEAWWRRNYYRPFVFAQRANERISGYADRQWDEKLAYLALFDESLIAPFLRAEFGWRHGLRLLGRHPAPVSRLLARRFLRRNRALRRAFSTE